MNEFDKIIPIELETIKGTIPYDYVMVEYNPNLTKKTPGQIYVSETYADEAGNINRMGIVTVVPKHLFFYQGEDKKRENRSMRWQTSVEIMEGDEIWFDHMSSINAFRYTHEGRFFKGIKYEDIVVAKRDGKIIMCNGSILLREIKEEVKFGVHSAEHTKQGIGNVAYIGARNNAYTDILKVEGGSTIYRTDLIDEVPVGSKISLFKEHYKHARHLEDSAQARFEGRDMFVIIKRYMIAMIDDNPVENCILVEPFKAEEFTKSGLTIVDSAKERPPKGIIVKLGSRISKVKEGATVIYNKKAGTSVAIDGKDYLVLREMEVLAIV